jgi:hypothetical protein
LLPVSKSPLLPESPSEPLPVTVTPDPLVAVRGSAGPEPIMTGPGPPPKVGPPGKVTGGFQQPQPANPEGSFQQKSQQAWPGWISVRVPVSLVVVVVDCTAAGRAETRPKEAAVRERRMSFMFLGDVFDIKFKGQYRCKSIVEVEEMKGSETDTRML